MFEKFVTTKNGGPAMLFSDGTIVGKGEYCYLVHQNNTKVAIFLIRWDRKLPIKCRRHPDGLCWWTSHEDLTPIKLVTQGERPVKPPVKPTLGLLPRTIYEDNERAARFMAVRGAIVNRMEMLMEIDPMWVDEYNSLLPKLNKEHVMGFRRELDNI